MNSIVRRALHTIGERTQNQQNGYRKKSPTGAPTENEDEGPHNIKLLLDAQRPEMKQGHGIGYGVKVTRFHDEEDVRRESSRGEDLFAEVCIFIGEEKYPSKGSDCNENKA